MRAADGRRTGDETDGVSKLKWCRADSAVCLSVRACTASTPPSSVARSYSPTVGRSVARDLPSLQLTFSRPSVYRPSSVARPSQMLESPAVGGRRTTHLPAAVVAPNLNLISSYSRQRRSHPRRSPVPLPSVYLRRYTPEVDNSFATTLAHAPHHHHSNWLNTHGHRRPDLSLSSHIVSLVPDLLLALVTPPCTLSPNPLHTLHLVPIQRFLLVLLTRQIKLSLTAPSYARLLRPLTPRPAALPLTFPSRQPCACPVAPMRMGSEPPVARSWEVRGDGVLTTTTVRLEPSLSLRLCN